MGQDLAAHARRHAGFDDQLALQLGVRVPLAAGQHLARGDPGRLCDAGADGAAALQRRRRQPDAALRRRAGALTRRRPRYGRGGVAILNYGGPFNLQNGTVAMSHRDQPLLESPRPAVSGQGLLRQLWPRGHGGRHQRRRDADDAGRAARPGLHLGRLAGGHGVDQQHDAGDHHGRHALHRPATRPRCLPAIRRRSSTPSPGVGTLATAVRYVASDGPRRRPHLCVCRGRQRAEQRPHRAGGDHRRVRQQDHRQPAGRRHRSPATSSRRRSRSSSCPGSASSSAASKGSSRGTRSGGTPE